MVFGMPKAAIERGYAMRIVALRRHGEYPAVAMFDRVRSGGQSAQLRHKFCTTGHLRDGGRDRVKAD